jgi:uncharacterized hydrophobic protein (TIGR00271 family)
MSASEGGKRLEQLREKRAKEEAEGPRTTQWTRRITSGIPRLERSERLELLERIEAGASGGVDYIVMMVLAGTLASLGLIQDSTAVVIGAMLVAPLMGPLIAAGLALPQGNLILFRKAVTVTLVGVAIGLVVAIVFGILNPGYEPSLEVEARGAPDLLDLVIAFASGFAAAYAMGRPNVVGTLAGVAIAAALVPPLSVVGIGLTNREFFIAGNAAVLLGTNLVAIILGAAAAFRMFGIHEAIAISGVPVWARRATIFLVLFAVLLSAPLLLRVLEKQRAGQARPLLYPVGPQVRVAANDYVGVWPDVQLIAIGRQSVEPESGILVILSSGHPVTGEFEDGLKAALQKARGLEEPVQIFSLLSARAAPKRE